jgi:hypothetical protein
MQAAFWLRQSEYAGLVLVKADKPARATTSIEY